MRAILEPDYFVKMIEKAEDARDKEIMAIEQGQKIKLTEPKKHEMTWAELQALPNDEYLMKTVLPPLYCGMQALELTRPVAPHEFLAMYLL